MEVKKFYLNKHLFPSFYKVLTKMKSLVQVCCKTTNKKSSNEKQTNKNNKGL